MSDEERREKYRQHCGFQVLLPDGSVKNVPLADAERGALRELVDAGATFPRPLPEDWSPRIPDPRGPMTVDNAVERAWEAYDAMAAEVAR